MPPTFIFVLFIIAISVGGSAILKMVTLWRQTSHAERMQRLKVLEEALRNPTTDANTREQLIAAVRDSGHGELANTWRGWFRANLTPRRVFGSAAWLGMIAGVLIAAVGGYRDQEAGIALAAISLAVLSLPHVVRELEQRAAKP